jgi:hypothetical protein
MVKLWRVIEIEYGVRLNNKNKPVESWHSVALFDDEKLAKEYTSNAYDNRDPKRVKEIIVRWLNVESVEKLAPDMRALPFNPVLPSNSSSANEDTASNGQENIPPESAESK